MIPHSFKVIFPAFMLPLLQRPWTQLLTVPPVTSALAPSATTTPSFAALSLIPSFIMNVPAATYTLWFLEVETVPPL